jgi:hypothetical protein
MLRKAVPPGFTKVLKRLHYPLDVILLCVRWYVAYSLSLRNLEEMMAERGFEVDHSTVHRWVITHKSGSLPTNILCLVILGLVGAFHEER